MKKTEDRLRELFQLESTRDPLISRENCPTPEELVLAFDPTAPVELKLRIIDHVSICPSCQREFELVRGSQQVIQQVEKRLLIRKTSFSQKLRFFFSPTPLLAKAAAAMILFLIALSIIILTANYWRNMQIERKTEKLKEPVLFEEIKKTDQPTIWLRWKPAPGAIFYRVEVFDQYMYLIWQSPMLSEPGLELPEPTMKSLKDSRYFFWQLKIYKSDKKIIESHVRKVNLLNQ